MKIVILILFLLSSNVFAQDILNIIENKRTHDQIISYCYSYKKDQCTHLEVKKFIYKENKEVSLKSYNYDNEDINSLPSYELMSLELQKKIKLMEEMRFEFLSFVRKVCSMSKLPYSTSGMCMWEVLGTQAIAQAFFIATGAVVSGGGILLVYAGTAAVGGIYDGKLIRSVNYLLLPPAFVLDVLKGITINPVRKIFKKLKNKKYREKVFPLVREIAEMNKNTNGRNIIVKNNIFKKVLDVLEQENQIKLEVSK